MRCEGKTVLVSPTLLFSPEDAVSVPPVSQEKVVNDTRLHDVTGSDILVCGHVGHSRLTLDLDHLGCRQGER
jgi:hypothetical protein